MLHSHSPSRNSFNRFQLPGQRFSPSTPTLYGRGLRVQVDGLVDTATASASFAPSRQTGKTGNLGCGFQRCLQLARSVAVVVRIIALAASNRFVRPTSNTCKRVASWRAQALGEKTRRRRWRVRCNHLQSIADVDDQGSRDRTNVDPFVIFFYLQTTNCVLLEQSEEVGVGVRSGAQSEIRSRAGRVVVISPRASMVNVVVEQS
ncbi:hypothetical protein Mapa_003704 [Marchantia paleacea]|nr:hypothetical protein Mapa_003704 [Marchantia paleacea]